MQKCARLARQVESSMMKLIGTRPRGFSISTPSALCAGRSPPTSASHRAASASCAARAKRRRRDGDGVVVSLYSSLSHDRVRRREIDIVARTQLASVVAVLKVVGGGVAAAAGHGGIGQYDQPMPRRVHGDDVLSIVPDN